MSKQVKKIIPYLLILIILVGLFSPMAPAHASTANPTEPCIYFNNYSTIATNEPCARSAVVSGGQPITATEAAGTDAEAASRATASRAAAVSCTGRDISTGQPTPAGCTGTPPETLTGQTKTGDEFKDEINGGCSYKPTSWFSGCLLLVFYYTIFQLPSIILWLSAQFFDAMINLGINSPVTSASGFIPTAWAVVRDLSNVFFILILLYIAIQTILGMGHETKKMIAWVIIMALLINFSMFFTKVVIDSSNILALVFYNKLTVSSTRPTDSSNPKDVKDISGEMWTTFDATKLITPETITKLKTTDVFGKKQVSDSLPFSLTLGIMVIAGAIMLFAAYAFFITGIMFVGRMIELWILIIFSPFAFMSSTVPKMAGIEYLGWEAWLKRLISTAFMAPIFMFFIYLIFMFLPNISKFNRSSELTILGTILNILVPAIVVMAMLLKATDFAKKGGGEFGAMALKGVKMAGGLALGAATGGAAMVATGTLGSLASRAASSKGVQDWAKQTGARGIAGRMALKTADYGTKASFDVRNIPGAKALARAGGLNIESSKAIGLGIKEGGYEKTRADKVKKRQERAKELEVREDEPLKQNLNNSEQDLQKMLNKVAKDFEEIDRDLVGARQKKSDAKEGTPDHDNAVADIKRLNGEKDNIKNGKTRDGTGVGVTVKGGANDKKTIKQMEKDVIPEEKNKIVTENRERRGLYADRATRYGRDVTVGGKTFYFGSETNREAAHKIRMEAKIESSSENKSHGGGGGGGHAPAPAHPPITPKAPTPRSGGGGGTPAASGGGVHGGPP